MPEPTIAVHITATTQGFQQGLKQAGGAVQNFAQQVNVAGQTAGTQFAQNTQKGGVAAKSFSAILMGVGVAAGQYALQGIVKLSRTMTGFIKNAVMSAARAEEMEGVLRNLGKQQGYSAQQMNEFTQSVVEAGIRTDVAQNLIAQFTRGEMDLTKASKIARVAQDAAVLSMSDSSETLSRLTYGIMTHNVLVLRTAGLTISAAQAYAEYAKTVGKTAGQLTEAEKTQAMMNAVMKEGENIAGTYETAMKAPGKMLRSLPRYFYEIGLEIGKSFLAPFADALAVVTKFAKTLKTMVQEGGELAPALKKLGEIAAALTKDLAEIGIEFIKRLPEIVKGAAQIGTQIKDTGDTVVLFAADVAGVLNVLRQGFRAVTAQTKAWGEFTTGLFPALVAGQEAVVSGFRAIGAAMLGNTDAAREHLAKMHDSFSQMRDYVKTVAEYQIDAFAAAGEAVGDAYSEGRRAVIDRFWHTAEEGADGATDAAEAHAQAIQNAAAEIEAAEAAMAEAIEAVNAEAQQKITELTIRETWRAIDEQIAAQRHLEDQQRRITQERAKMQADYNRAVQQAAREHGERRAEIERDYQKRIAEIQADFAVSEEEAIRSRDALALVNARRQRDRDLKEAENARNEQVADAERHYQEQLERAREALQQQEQELQEALAREAEEKRLADQREAEDLKRAHDREMGQIRTHQGMRLSEIYNANQSEITAMQNHYNELLRMASWYYQQMAGQRANWYTGPTAPGGDTGVQMMQHGGAGVVTRPTLFMAGEAGPEAFAFAPLGRGDQVVAAAGTAAGGRGRTTINQNFQFHGSFSEEEREWFRRVAREESRNGMSEAFVQ